MEIPWIQLIVNALTILITALLTYHFAKQRYTFEKLHDRKLICLEEIYSKIISLETDLNKYIITTGADMNKEVLHKKSETIAPIMNKFFDLQKFFWEKEIILEEKTNISIQLLIDHSIKVLSGLKASIISQSISDPNTAYKQWNNSFQNMESKFAELKKQLKKEFRREIEKNYIT
jgi:hypothetical protein